MARKRERTRRLSVTGFERESKVNGVYYDETPILNELPEVGTSVIVREKKVYEGYGVDSKEYRKDMDIQFNTVTVNASSYLDVWGRPRVYCVKEYTKGRENPLEEGNWVKLECKMGKQIKIDQIPTKWIASGCMLLCPV